jgi:Cu/Ag efflux pump CusA
MLLLPGAAGAVEPPLLRRLQDAYDRLLRRIQGERLLVGTATIVLLAAGVVALTNLGGQFLPELRESHFVIHMRGLPGTSLTQSLTMGKEVTRELLKNPMVRSVSQQAGRAELGEETWGVEYSELEVDLRNQAAEDIEQAQKELGDVLKEVPGFSFEIYPFLSERIAETLSGTPQAVVVRIQGDDLGKLDRAAAEIAQVLAAIPGHDNVRAEQQTGSPELVVRIRHEDAVRYGLRNSQILDAVHAAYQGAEVGQVYDRNRIIDLLVILEPSARKNPEAVGNLWLSVPASPLSPAPGERGMREGAAASLGSGGADTLPVPGRIQLKEVADVFLSDGRFLISHEGGLRRQQVTCNVKGGDVESFVAEAERRVRELNLPEGVSYVFSGEHEAKETAQRELLLLALAAGIGILLLLWLAFGSVGRLLLILVNLPFALVGGIAAVYMNGGILDVGSLIGFVTLFGITTRNGIMMVSHWQHLREVEGMPWGPELVFRGARERLAPVLMTALVTGLGLLPIALGSGEAGREIEGPMAMVILGGLVTSTALNLFLLPMITLSFRPQMPASADRIPA